MISSVSILLVLFSFSAGSASASEAPQNGVLVDLSCTPVSNFKKNPISALHIFNLAWAWHDFEGNHLPHGYLVVDDKDSSTSFIARTNTLNSSGAKDPKFLSYLSVYQDLSGREKILPDEIVLPNRSFKEFTDPMGVKRTVFKHAYELYTWEIDLDRRAVRRLGHGKTFKALVRVSELGPYAAPDIDSMELRCTQSDQGRATWLAQIVFGVEQARSSN